MHADDHREAAAQGDAGAQYALGLCYLSGGDGLRTDLVEAERLIRLSANQGYARAQLALAVMYKNGNCVLRQNYLEAARWCRRAIRSWWTLPQRYLNAMFETQPGLQEERAANDTARALQSQPTDGAVSAAHDAGKAGDVRDGLQVCIQDAHLSCTDLVQT